MALIRHAAVIAGSILLSQGWQFTTAAQGNIFNGMANSGIFPLRQFPLCQFPLCQFPFGQLPTLSIPTLSILIWSMLTKWELTKWELTKWEVDKVGMISIFKKDVMLSIQTSLCDECAGHYTQHVL